MIWWQYIVPQHLLSKLMFALTRIENPWLKNTLISWFVKTYQVDLSIAKRENIKDYQNFNDFFTRSLKSNARQIAGGRIICPVDGVVSQLGNMDDMKMIQAKGRFYHVDALLASKTKARPFQQGYFATIYLAPKDYHRVHMPYDARLIAMDYIPGDLFSVNQKTTQSIKHLFARNERVVCYFATEFGACAFVLVGAIFVGSMQTVWHGQITPPYLKKMVHFDYLQQDIHLKKGDELGRFNMGSTVIMLMSNLDNSFNLTKNQIVKMGQALV